MRSAFENIKRALINNVVLDIADPTKPYLAVDSSDFAVGGVLAQEDSDGNL